MRFEAVVVLRRRGVARFEHHLGIGLRPREIAALQHLDAAGDVALAVTAAGAASASACCSVMHAGSVS